MNKPSIDQVLNAIGFLMNNADWDAVNTSTLQKVIDNPKDSGHEFTAFLKNGGRVIVGEPKVITIDRTSAFDPVAFIGKGWSIVEQDEHSLVLTEVGLTRIKFVTTLTNDETYLTSEDNLKCLKAKRYILLDAKFCQALWEDYKSDGENSLLESLRRTQGVTFLDFPGTELQSSFGCQCVLCLSCHYGKWLLGYNWFSCKGHTVHRPSAVLAS